LTQPDVKKLLEQYNTANITGSKIGMARAKVLLTEKGLYINKDGIITSVAKDATKTYPKLKPIKGIKVKAPVDTTAQKAWEKGLDQDQIDSMDYWSTNDDAMTNVRHLQAGDTKHMTAKEKDITTTFIKTTENAPKYVGKVYRGSGIDSIQASIKPGETFKFRGGVSTSKKMSIGKEFAEASPDDAVAIFEVHTKSGADISKVVVQRMRREAEVFLPKDVKFKVISKKFVKNLDMDNGEGYWKIILEEI